MSMTVTDSLDTWLDDVSVKIEAKIDAELKRLKTAIPYIPVNGRYSDRGATEISWWTNGFWAGILWQLYYVNKKDYYREAAEKVEERLDEALEEFLGLHHDIGFMWLHTAVANYRLTKNQNSYRRAMHAANLLAGRYNLAGKFIRSWNKDRTGWVIVDSMLNLPLLYWASEETADPRFKFIAENHADTVMNSIVRGDGSVNHIVVFNAENGEIIEALGGQGYGAGSAWSRGQAWAIYGFALSYYYSKKIAYLETAKKVAHYFIANIERNSFISLVDFRAPAENETIDTTAGLCAACGLLKIAELVDEFEKNLYKDAAIKILRATEASYANWDLSTDGIISHGTVAYHDKEGRHVPIIYGDYYFLEAVLRLKRTNFEIW